MESYRENELVLINEDEEQELIFGENNPDMEQFNEAIKNRVPKDLSVFDKIENEDYTESNQRSAVQFYVFANGIPMVITLEQIKRIIGSTGGGGTIGGIKFRVEGESLEVSYDDGETWTAIGIVKGEDGKTPYIQDGYWYIDGVNTNVKAEGIDGTNGKDGADGVSATHSWNGTTLTITSASGTSSANLKGEKGDKGEQGIQGTQGVQGIQGKQGIPGVKGDKGDKGDGFSIAKTYPSIVAMNAGYSTDGVPLNGFVLINTGNVNDADNAKLFVKLENGYSYLTDLSGSQGIQGEKGEKGEQGIQGEKGIRGEQGIQGVQGIQGEKGADGKDGNNGADGVGISKIEKTSTNGKVDTYTITLTNGTKSTFTVTNGNDGSNGTNGTNGKDGTSVTVKSVSESTADGGSNVVTFSDNKTITIKNGSKGSKGDKGDKGDTGATGANGRDGANGYTPIRGVDYYTEADKAEIVLAVIDNLGGTPLFGYVDSNNNVVLKGNLVDGEYNIKYEMNDGSKVNIGDLVLDSNTYYTITSKLTNCTISNSTKEVVEGSSYSATITANSGYELSSVTVTMGGSPISVTNGVIYISNVTGDIVITASAKAEALNLIKSSVNTDGTAFGTNGIVYGKRWNSSGSLGNGQANTTGLIACKAGDIVLLEKCGLYQNKFNEAHRVTFWNASKGILGYEQPWYLSGTYMTDVQFENSFVTQFTVKQDGFFAVSGINDAGATSAGVTDYLDENSKITIKSAS